MKYLYVVNKQREKEDKNLSNYNLFLVLLLFLHMNTLTVEDKWELSFIILNSWLVCEFFKVKCKYTRVLRDGATPEAIFNWRARGGHWKCWGGYKKAGGWILTDGEKPPGWLLVESYLHYWFTANVKHQLEAWYTHTSHDPPWTLLGDATLLSLIISHRQNISVQVNQLTVGD